MGIFDVSIWWLIFEIGAAIYCFTRAQELNRNKWGWGVFGFILPIVAVILIQFMKHKTY